MEDSRRLFQRIRDEPLLVLKAFAAPNADGEAFTLKGLEEQLEVLGYTKDHVTESFQAVLGISVQHFTATTKALKDPPNSQSGSNNIITTTDTFTIKAPPGVYRVTKIGDRMVTDPKQPGLIEIAMRSDGWNYRTITIKGESTTGTISGSEQATKQGHPSWRLQASFTSGAQLDLGFWCDLEGDTMSTKFVGTATNFNGKPGSEQIEGILDEDQKRMSNLAGFLVNFNRALGENSNESDQDPSQDPPPSDLKLPEDIAHIALTLTFGLMFVLGIFWLVCVLRQRNRVARALVHQGEPAVPMLPDPLDDPAELPDLPDPERPVLPMDPGRPSLPAVRQNPLSFSPLFRTGWGNSNFRQRQDQRLRHLFAPNSTRPWSSIFRVPEEVPEEDLEPCKIWIFWPSNKEDDDKPDGPTNPELGAPGTGASNPPSKSGTGASNPVFGSCYLSSSAIKKMAEGSFNDATDMVEALMYPFAQPLQDKAAEIIRSSFTKIDEVNQTVLPPTNQLVSWTTIVPNVVQAISLKPTDPSQPIAVYLNNFFKGLKPFVVQAALPYVTTQWVALSKQNGLSKFLRQFAWPTFSTDLIEITIERAMESDEISKGIASESLRGLAVANKGLGTSLITKSGSSALYEAQTAGLDEAAAIQEYYAKIIDKIQELGRSAVLTVENADKVLKEQLDLVRVNATGFAPAAVPSELHALGQTFMNLAMIGMLGGAAGRSMAGNTGKASGGKLIGGSGKGSFYGRESFLSTSRSTSASSSLEVSIIR